MELAEEDYPLEFMDGLVYDEREEKRKDKIADSPNKAADTMKMQTEGSPFRKRVSIWDHVFGTIAIGGAVVFGWKVLLKLVA